MRVTEALHLRAFGRYMIRAPCYIKPTHFLAVVTVFISCRLNFYGWALSLASFWGLVEVLARILWTPSHLLHESAMIRDQVCPSSNDEGCLLTHPLFAIYKPDPLACAAHLRPPPSRRLSTSIFVQLYPSKERMRVVALAHPFVALIGCVQFERLFTLLSLQTMFERVTG